MGYSTDYSGTFQIDPPLAPKDELDFRSLQERLSNSDDLDEELSLAHLVTKLPAGEIEGGYLQWELQRDRMHTTEGYSKLGWDGGEKFYNAAEWLQYLIDAFFKPRGYTVSDYVLWAGEDTDDIGVLAVEDGVVKKYEGTHHYPPLAGLQGEIQAYLDQTAHIEELGQYEETSVSFVKRARHLLTAILSSNG